MTAQPHVESLLSAYLDGALAPDEALAVERHLASCRACQQAYEELQATVALLQSVPEVAPPPGLRDDVMRRLQAEAARSGRQEPAAGGGFRRFVTQSPWRFAAAAALVLALAGIGGLATFFAAFSPGGAPAAGPTLMHSARVETVSPEVFDGGVDDAVSGFAAAPERVEADLAIRGEAGGIARGDGDAGAIAAPPAADALRDLPAGGGRTIIRRGSLSVDVDDVQTAYQTVQQLVQDKGGYVESSSLGRETLYNPGRLQRHERPVAHLGLRVPAEQLMDLIEQICLLGDDCTYQTTGEDVTEQYVDTAAYLRTLQAQEARLLELLDQASSVDEVLNVERELWRVRGQIDRIEGQLRYWERASALSSLQVTLREPEPLGFGDRPQGIGGRLLGLLLNALQLLVQSAEWILLGFAVVLPWVLLITLGWWAYRRWR